MAVCHRRLFTETYICDQHPQLHLCRCCYDTDLCYLGQYAPAAWILRHLSSFHASYCPGVHSADRLLRGIYDTRNWFCLVWRE